MKIVTPGIVYLILAQTMVAISIVASKQLVSSIPIAILMAIRFLLAAMVLLGLHCTLDKSKPTSIKNHLLGLKQKDWLFIIAQALCAGLLFNCFMMTGLSYTDANVAGIITSALPAIIAIFSWLILKEHISTQKVFCILFATFGLLIIAIEKFHNNHVSHSFLGDLLLFLALLPEATYYVLCKIYQSRLPVFLISSLINGINAAILFPLFLFIHWTPDNINLLNWLLVLIIGLSSGLFYVFWLVGAEHVDGVLASLSTAIMPIATVLLSWVCLGEQLTPIELVGMGLVLFSILIYAKR